MSIFSMTGAELARALSAPAPIVEAVRVERPSALQSVLAAIASMSEADKSVVRAALRCDAPETAQPARSSNVVKFRRSQVPAALTFWHTHRMAVEAIRAEYGDHWKCAAPVGKTILATLASGLRSAKTERGTTLRWCRDHRMPAAEYWPGGVLPDGIVTVPEGDRAAPVPGHSERCEYDLHRADFMRLMRDRRNAKPHAVNGKSQRLEFLTDIARGALERAREARQRLLATGAPLHAPVFERSADWHLAHGYVWHNGQWVADILARAAMAHAEAIEANRQRAEQAEIDVTLADAAD